MEFYPACHALVRRSKYENNKMHQVLLGKSSRNAVTYEELQTALYKIELALKNTPLKFTLQNPNNAFQEPNHVFHGRRLNVSQKKTAQVLTITISASEIYYSILLGGGKTSIFQNFLSFINRKLVTKLKKHVNLKMQF